MKKPIFDPYELCPCESGLKAKFCCLEPGKTWNKKPSTIREETSTGYQHQKCYASPTKNCSTKISSEHYFSNNILEVLEHNKTVKIGGLPWLEKDSFNLLSRKALVSNILCKTHNEMLSVFDTEMGRFYRTLLEFDEDFNSENPKNEIKIFCGEDLERWMLKTVCNLIASNQIAEKGKVKTLLVKEDYIDILYNDNPFPNKWGLYFSPANQKVQKFNSLYVIPKSHEKELKAAEFGINNFKFNFLLSVQVFFG